MKWFKAEALADNPRIAKVVIDKPIGSDWAPDWIADLFGEQPARQFIEAIDALGELDEILLEINSPGGDVASGVRIMNYLRNHEAQVHARVTGMAASIATVILMGADTRTMAIGATLMTHRASALLDGYFTAAEMMENAEALTQLDRAMVDAYTEATGKTAEEIEGLLDRGDVYMGAEEALEWGFATSKDGRLKAVASADPSLFRQQLAMQGQVRELERELSAVKAAQAPEVSMQYLRTNHGDLVAEIEATAREGYVKESASGDLVAQAVKGERERVTAIAAACETTGQMHLVKKLAQQDMATELATEYVFDVAAAAGNSHSIHNSHSPEGGHGQARINHNAIYARYNRKAQA